MKKIVLFLNCILLISLSANDLPKSVLLEKYLIAAKQYEDEGRYKKAIENFDKIEKLHITLPKEFFYRYAVSLYHDKRYRESDKYLKEYLLQSDRDDKYYKSALEYMILLEDEEYEAKVLKKRCDELPDLIEENLTNCKENCETSVNNRIDGSLYSYPNNTSSELYNTWYPKCFKECKNKKVNKLQREYKRRCK